ncbi:MAG: PLP-dependent aminotransferase family protein [bacterium]|nr:PLP-dependent aminotransferase family protein [bacterium]MDE0353162.1 PLP-dependent aminotransferase family protein [bacterium]
MTSDQHYATVARLSDSLSDETNKPRFRRLKDGLTRAIERGELHGGEMLPSSRVLADHLDVSRNTVNRAYRELAVEGFIEPIERVGYVVNEGLGDGDAGVPHRDGSSTPPRVRWDERLDALADGHDERTRPAGWRSYPYPFVVGPGPEAFPIGSWTRAMRMALREEHRGTSLHNLDDQDDPLLVEQIRRIILPARGIQAAPDQILVTLGTQHGLHLVAEALLGAGSTVGVEDPGYPDARRIFLKQEAKLVPLPVDAHGATAPEGLSGLDFVFITPGRQFPTNVTMTIGRRRKLLAQAARDGALIVEDDYDSEYCYSRRPPPALKALDTTGRVVYVGSFSKFLAPGLRLGFVVADPVLIDYLRRLRHHMLRHPPGIIQRTTALMMEVGDYGRVIRRHRRVLRSKWQAITEAVDDLFPWPVPGTDGGMSLWVAGPEDLDAAFLAERALDDGVVIEPGRSCFLGPVRPARYFQLGFAAIDREAIRPGIERLARFL